jgi:ElaB/YqjD/DUF883 family membrane-anchored ribosome-binding protein
MTNPERNAGSKFDESAATVEDIQRELKVVRDDLARLAQQISTLLGASGSEAVREVKVQVDRFRERLDEVVADASEKGLDAVDSVRESADTLIGSLEDSVRKRPIPTLGIALGLGFLIGATWRR